MSYSNFKLKHLLQANVHLGHRDIFLVQKLYRYLIGIRKDICILNIELTILNFFKISKILSSILLNRGHILLIGNTVNYNHLIGGLDESFKSILKFSLYFSISDFKSSYTVSLAHLGLLKNKTQSVLFFNPLENKPYINEVVKLCIPIITIIDSNINIDTKKFMYVIPGNDDSPAAILLYCNIIYNICIETKSQSYNLFTMKTKDYIVNNINYIDTNLKKN